MKKWYLFAIGLLVGSLCFADSPDEQPEEFVFILGPRVGIGYVLVSPTTFSEQINDFTGSDYDYYPVNSSFGVSLEQRIVLGNTRNHFAFQEICSINGLEQALALPVVAALIGYRDASGFEIGTGPLLSISGLQIVIAIGWTIQTRGINIPIDISFTPPNAEASASIALTTGFNFVVSKRRPRSDLYYE